VSARNGVRLKQRLTGMSSVTEHIDDITTKHIVCRESCLEDSSLNVQQDHYQDPDLGEPFRFEHGALIGAG